MNLPPGVAPSSPVNGDLWTTNAGLFAQVNGSTIGPIGAGAGFFAATFPLTVAFPSGVTTYACATCATSTLNTAALTSTSDANVTITLGGSPSTALLNAASITMGWSGQLSLARGGTNNSLTASNGGVVWSDASKFNVLAGTATANLPLLSGATATPAWATISYPTSANSGGVPYFSSSTAMGSSGTLTQNGVVYGGGAGNPPSSTAAGAADTVLMGSAAAPSFVSVNNCAGAVTYSTSTHAWGCVGTVRTVSTTASLATTDCFNTVGLGGSAFYTFTIGAVAGFPNCPVTIVNLDNNRGKTISGVNLPWGAANSYPNILWPSMSFALNSMNATNWSFTAAQDRWKPAGAVTFNTDFTNGNDNNDGQATGTGNALKTVNQCLQITVAVLDLAGGNNGVTCEMAASSTDSTLVHWAPHGGAPGSFGNGQIIIDGQSSATLSGGLQFFHGAVLMIQNVTLTNASGDCLQSQWNANPEIQNITFGACSGNAMNLLFDGQLSIVGSLTWSGNTGIFILIQNGGLVQGTGITITLTQNVTVTDTVAANYNATVNLSGVTWTLGGHTVTATHSYACAGNAVILGSASIPGTGAASSASGCQPL